MLRWKNKLSQHNEEMSKETYKIFSGLSEEEIDEDLTPEVKKIVETLKGGRSRCFKIR